MQTLDSNDNTSANNGKIGHRDRGNDDAPRLVDENIPPRVVEINMNTIPESVIDTVNDMILKPAIEVAQTAYSIVEKPLQGTRVGELIDSKIVTAKQWKETHEKEINSAM